MSNRQPHIVIIGAGPAGSSCAIALRELGCDVTIIDSGKADKFHIGESTSPDMNAILQSLGIYNEFLKIKMTPCYGSCSYWGSELRGYNDSVLSPYGHGWHLDRREFNEFLIEVAKRKGAKVEVKSTFTEVTIRSTGVSVNYENALKQSLSLNGDFVVDASGYRSVVSTCLGSKKKNGKPLICLARRFRIDHDQHLPYLTHLESVEHGWWYAARVPDNNVLVSLYTTANVVRQLKLSKIDSWISLLKDAPRTAELIPALNPIDTQILGFSITSFSLDQITGENWVAIGDAASTYDPIMANGILKSVTHGINVAPAIFRYVQSSNQEELLRFEEQVKHEYKGYTLMRSQFYNMENRWADSDFWQQMHSTEESILA